MCLCVILHIAELLVTKHDVIMMWQKLVNETFQSMWFMPVRDCREATASRLLQRVMNITDVVAACRDSGFEWLEQLLDNVIFAFLVYNVFVFNWCNCCLWIMHLQDIVFIHPSIYRNAKASWVAISLRNHVIMHSLFHDGCDIPSRHRSVSTCDVGDWSASFTR